MVHVCASVPFRFQEALCINGGHATRSCCSYGLPVRAILHIARMKDARDVRTCSAVVDNVAVGVDIELPNKSVCVRDVPDCNEKTVHFAIVCFSRVQVAQPHSSHITLTDVMNVLNNSVGEELNLWILLRAF